MTARVTHGSARTKPGNSSATRSSQESRPSATRVPTAAAVNPLLSDAIGKTVSPSTGCDPPRARVPKPRTSATRPSTITATASPGVPHSARALST